MPRVGDHDLPARSRRVTASSPPAVPKRPRRRVRSPAARARARQRALGVGRAGMAGPAGARAGSPRHGGCSGRGSRRRTEENRLGFAHVYHVNGWLRLPRPRAARKICTQGYFVASGRSGQQTGVLLCDGDGNVFPVQLQVRRLLRMLS